QQQIAKAAAFAHVRELVFAATRAAGPPLAPLDLARVGKPQPRLAEEIEPDIGQCDVFLEHRSVTDPLAEALGEYQIAVGKAQDVIEELLVGCHVRCGSLHRAWERRSDADIPCCSRARTSAPFCPANWRRCRRISRPRC